MFIMSFSCPYTTYHSLYVDLFYLLNFTSLEPPDRNLVVIKINTSLFIINLAM